jgi:hypothetical protein
MIRDRDPRADRDCDNQGTRTCSHTQSIGDTTGMLKYFLLPR